MGGRGGLSIIFLQEPLVYCNRFPVPRVHRDGQYSWQVAQRQLPRALLQLGPDRPTVTIQARKRINLYDVMARRRLNIHVYR